MDCPKHGTFPGASTCFGCINEQMDNAPKQPKKTRKPSTKRLRRVSVALMLKQGRTILAREMDRLMEISHASVLTKDESQSLRAYLEILNELSELDKINALENEEKEAKENVQKKSTTAH